MEYFPQLETGAMGQYPLRRTRRTRTIENRLAGGERVRLADPAALITEWQLTFQGLTDHEAEVLTGFFNRVEGRLHTFTFLDPADNLLAWSEKLEAPVWVKAPLTTVSGGFPDPAGGTAAWQVWSVSQAAVWQTLNVPAWFSYCLSVYARCNGGTTMALTRGTQRSEHRVTDSWQRFAFRSSGDGTDESVRFGLEAPSGAAVEVFGFQVEPQIGASGYRKTTSASGVYPNARLGDDRLNLTAVAAGRHDCTLSVIHGEHL